MALANFFYHETTRRYIALFGSIFNKLSIQRHDGNGALVQKMVVPISYGPYQKFLHRLDTDPNLDRKAAISLPRMAFEITSMDYDDSRKLPVKNKIKFNRQEGSTKDFAYTPTPFNVNFNLYIMVKNAEDATQLVEQIIPFFSPEWTPTVQLIDGMDPFDLPIVYHGLSIEDIYEGAFETRRSLVWTLSFTLKGWYFKPIQRKSIIKFTDVRTSDENKWKGNVVNRVTVQPSMTEDGEPTYDLSESIPYQEIEEEDDWAAVTVIEEYIDDE